MTPLMQACGLAWNDYCHEKLLSACAVLGLAAVLAPLLVLLGVHHGIITAMTEQLRNDPRTLEVTPVGSGKYGPDWFAELTALPGVNYVVPQTRSIAATINLRRQTAEGLKQAHISLIASSKGDPLWTRWRGTDPAATPPPGWAYTETGPNAALAAKSTLAATVILSHTAAAKLQAGPGDLLTGLVDRIRNDKRESARIAVRVSFVLPVEAQSSDIAYVPLEMLVAAEDYRDGKAVLFLQWEGDSPERDANSAPHSAAPAISGESSPSPFPGTSEKAPGGTPEGTPGRTSGETRTNGTRNELPAGGLKSTALHEYARDLRSRREFASFRLYARGMDDVEPLRQWFVRKGVEVYVKSAEIETVRSLDRAFTIVFGLITGAAMFGFVAATASNALAGVRRKSRSLGLMRLMGFSRGGMLLFPVMQTLSTGLFGSVLAYGLYLGVAFSIDRLFASTLPGGQAVCTLPWTYAAAVLGVVLALSTLSSLSAAWQATTIEPSEVIRDV